MIRRGPPEEKGAVSFEIRAALPQDVDDLTRLARHLNTVNLPADREAIRKLLDTSQRSFSGALPPEHRIYVFVLRDLAQGMAIGTSTIVARLGRRDAPYIYFDVGTEEKYSKDLGVHFNHTVLRLGFSYAGPTELAGLVVDPAYRKHPGRMGLAISYARFLFVAAHRELFQPQLLAELLPPLEADGTSHLWNALGRRFTNMTYRHADRLSHENKDFIRDLFPSGAVYASLLSPAAQAVIGEVGHQTLGVEKMLRRVGFEYAKRVDPFDGGPHFVAPTDQISVVRAYQASPACPWVGTGPPPSQRRHRLLAKLTTEPPYFRAVRAIATLSDGCIATTTDVLEHLDCAPNDILHSVPLP
jgi:arginine N-succinyltransferase